ncbi:MAG TPA: LPS-assembly protein LptD [Firmicutes bacterium]|nr:LPS-assembly protein LptD [Bacillota bacterium]
MRFGKTALTILSILFLLLMMENTPVLAVQPRAVEIEARLVEFDPATKIYKATGGVHFISGDFRLQADTVIYYQETDLVTAEQRVKVQTAEGNWEGENLVYSFRDQQGKMTALTGQGGQYYLSGKTGEFNGEEILVEGATFTPCELAIPCLKIKAGQVRLVNDKVQVKRGWLCLKNLPVLPLPPLTFATDQFEDWPQLQVGANNTRGAYVTGKLTHQITKGATLSYGGGVGTKEWWNAQAGLRWNLTSNLIFNSTFTWEDYLRGSASLTYKHAPLQVTTAVNRNWAKLVSGEHSLTVQGPLSKKSTLALSHTSSFNERTRGMHRRKDSGLRLTGRWLPGFTLGAGLYYGAGDLKKNSLNGWHLRTTWSGGINIARTLRIETAGETRWQKGIEPLWVEKTVKLVKDLHCFKVDLGYDLLDESYSLNFGFNW